MENLEIKKEPEQTFLSERTLLSQVHSRSDIAQEFISQRTGFLERWALYIFLFLLLLLLAGSWFLKYPDVIETRAVLTAANGPKEILNREAGRLARLFVHNNERVQKQQVIGWIESTASHHEVTDLAALADSCKRLLEQGEMAAASGLFKTRFSNLGPLQHNYQDFMAIRQQFNDYYVNGYYENRRKILQKDVEELDSLRFILLSEKTIREEDVKLARESYDMNERLSEDRVLSREQLRTEKSRYLNKEVAIPQLSIGILSNQSGKRSKIKELLQMEHELLQQEFLFRQALELLRSSIDEWQRQYLLIAPVEGKVSFIRPLQENQFLQNNTLLGFVEPEHTEFYAETRLPQNNFGKVKTGYKVQLRFDAYPYQENGYVEGMLHYVSAIPADSSFLATIQLNNGLNTNNHLQLPYKSGLTAQALIITADMRLLERLYYGMVKILSVNGKH